MVSAFFPIIKIFTYYCLYIQHILYMVSHSTYHRAPSPTLTSAPELDPQYFKGCLRATSRHPIGPEIPADGHDVQEVLRGLLLSWTITEGAGSASKLPQRQETLMARPSLPLWPNTLASLQKLHLVVIPYVRTHQLQSPLWKINETVNQQTWNT